MLLTLIVTSIVAVVILCLSIPKTHLIGLALWLLFLFIQPGIFAVITAVVLIAFAFHYWLVPRLHFTRRLTHDSSQHE